jgi:hypothetical protein
MSPTNEALLLVQKRIRENATTYFPALAGRPLRIRCRPLRAGSNPLYRCELGPGSGSLPRADIIIKFAPKPLRIEFDNLTLLYEHRSQIARGLVVPRPLDFFPDVNALLTERIDGEPFSRLVLRKLHVFASPRVRKSIAARIRLCGKWLAHYHRLTRRLDARPFEGKWMERVSREIDELEGIGFPQNAIDTARTTLSRLQEVGKCQLVPYAHKHGDFGFHNVHAGDDWVCVFDLNDNRPVCVYEDLALFLVSLETKNKWPRYPLFDRRLAAAMKPHFLQGYFESHQNSHRVLLEGYTLTRLLIHCSKQRRSVAARSRSLLPLFDAFRLHRFYAPRVLRQCELLDRLLLDEAHRPAVGRLSSA